MSTPLTMTRLVRWRARDWASCLLACRFPIDEESERYCSSTPQLPIKSMALDTKSDRRGKRVSKLRRLSKERRQNQGVTQVKEALTMENEGDDSNWPHFEEEDYIVFCFREDGAIEVIKDGKSETPNSIDFISASPRPVNRKLNYGENTKAVKRYIIEEKLLNGYARDVYPANDGELVIPHQKDEEEDGTCSDTESQSGGIRRKKSHIEGADGCRNTVSTESSDSNHSDGSGGSFAFPVLGWEWSGSPVKMPKSEALQLRKHKPRCVGLQCWRF